jgi:release factor glutamine methyltransferase
MFVQSNRLVDLLPYFHQKLAGLYEAREIENIFAWLCHDRFRLNRNEIKSEGVRLSESELLDFRSVVKRLQTNEPLQYVLGKTEFYNCEILLNRHVLIPRPETEELVDLIFKSIGRELTILDIGTGSGCIPIALKKAKPTCQLIGLDISHEALDIAQKSALLNEVDILFYQADILTNNLENLPQFDLIISNPPYVLESDKIDMSKNVLDFEPHLALFVPDHDPLRFYRRIAEVGLSKLNPNGFLYFEIHERFGQETLEMLNALGYSNGEIIKDMQSKDRMVKAVWLSE